MLCHVSADQPIVVARDGKPVKVDLHTMRTLREEHAQYGQINNE